MNKFLAFCEAVWIPIAACIILFVALTLFLVYTKLVLILVAIAALVCCVIGMLRSHHIL